MKYFADISYHYQVTKHLNTRQLRRLYDLQQQISKEMNNVNATSDNNAARGRQQTGGGLDRLRGLISPAVDTHNDDDVAVFVPKVDQLKVTCRIILNKNINSLN